MNPALGPALAAALLLAATGPAKLRRPEFTVGALRSVGLPATPWAVRAGAVVELALGIAGALAGGRALWAAVAAAYLGFAGFVALALTRGGAVSSCGCAGRPDTPPHVAHVALNLVLAAAAVSAAVQAAPGLVSVSGAAPGRLAVLAGLACLAAWLGHLVLTALPQLRVAGPATAGTRPPPPVRP